MSDQEPKRPEMPEDVSAWLDERLEPGVALSALDEMANDLPPNVASWYAAHCAWRDEREAWAKRQPLDWKGNSFAWRMFGGPWLNGMTAIETTDEAGDRRVRHLHTAIGELTEAGTPEPELRRIAGAIYEWRAMDRAAQERIAAMLRREPA